MFEIVVMVLTLFANMAAAAGSRPVPSPAWPEEDPQGPALNGYVDRPGLYADVTGAEVAPALRGFTVVAVALPDGTRLAR